MFKVIYRCNRTIERHTNSPLANPRRRYLEHQAAGGANPSMMRNAAARYTRRAHIPASGLHKRLLEAVRYARLATTVASQRNQLASRVTTARLQMPPLYLAAMVNPLRTFWQRISDGIEVQKIWMDFHREARASYAIYGKEVDSRVPEGHSRWVRFLEVSRILFWAMVLKLSPGRRVLLLLSLLVLAVPLFTFRYQGLTFWGGTGLLILLALELADRVIMKRDLEIAREIQNWLMPATPPAVPGADIAFESRAANTVAGDYYDVLFRAPDSARASTEPERLLFIVADVVGKSVPAALLMATLQASLRTLAALPISLLELIESLNQYVCAQNISGCRYSTAFVAELEPGDGRLTYVNAGHNWPVLRRADRRLERLETGGLPLGIMSSAQYQCGATNLAAGDVLLIFSDGLIEAEDDNQQEFGEPAMLAVMDDACGKSAADVLAQLLRSVDSFVGPAHQHDDITCMVVRISARH